MTPTSVRLALAMKERNISLQELSASAGLPKEEIQAYLDHIRLLHVDAAAKLGKALRVPWVWLMGVGDDAFPQQ